MSDWRDNMIAALRRVHHTLQNDTIPDVDDDDLRAIETAADELEEPTCCMCGEAVKYHHCNKDST